jgi:hypothetical protein
MMTATAVWPTQRIDPWRISLAILGSAASLYVAWAIWFLSDPATSWVHVESANGAAVVRSINDLAWSTRWGEMLKGVATDANSSRFRPVSHIVEHLDEFLRRGIVAQVGFIPAFANFSSLIYFAVCPVLAFLIARQLLGLSPVAAVVIALALGAFLTSVGYNSPSIFIFRPAKKIINLLVLAQLLAAVWYMHAPRLRLVVALGAMQFLAAMTDEVGLVAGALTPLLCVIYVLANRRAPVSHLYVLVAFWVLTALGFLYGASLRPVSNFTAPSVSSALAALLTASFYSSFAAHLAGAFSALYAPTALKVLWLVGIATALIIRPRATTLIAAILLLANVGFATLILTYGGAEFMSQHGYYYASVLSVFAFFLTCAALLSGNLATRAVLGVALVGSIGANIIQAPRLNHAVAVMHNNPYPVEAINRAGDAALAGKATAHMPGCSPSNIGATLDLEFSHLGIDRSRLYGPGSPFPPQPVINERFLPSVYYMMLRNPPHIEIEAEQNASC